MTMNVLMRSALAVSALALSGTAQATVAFESFPNFTAAGMPSGDFCSSCTGAGAVFASFTLATPQTLDKAFVVVSTLAGSSSQATNPMTISIFNDGGDDLPIRDGNGSILNPFLTTPYHTPANVTPGGARIDGMANYVAEFALPNWSLAQGKYWIRFAGSSNLLPLFSTSTPTNSRAVGTDFFLEGRAITFNPPDRAVGFSLNGLSASGPGAVPEPATWAMMVVGFGTVGFALRRRRAVSVRYA